MVEPRFVTADQAREEAIRVVRDACDPGGDIVVSGAPRCGGMVGWVDALTMIEGYEPEETDPEPPDPPEVEMWEVRIDEPLCFLTLLFAADGHLCGAALMDDTDLDLG